MKTPRALFVTAAFTLAMVACKKDGDSNPDRGFESSNGTDITFAQKASYSNTAEISAGQTAAMAANSAAVRSFGQMMVTEHTEAQNKLQVAANNARLSISNDTTTLAAMRSTLMMYTGRAFDSVYLTMQVAAHQETLNLLQSEVDGGVSASLKGYAAEMIPHVQMHLRVADSLLQHL